MAGWTAEQYLTAITTNLKARAGLDGVQIWSSPIAKDELELEAIAFIDIVSEDEDDVIGNPPSRREEVYEIEGVIEVNSPGMGDDVATTARARAIELFAEIENEVRINPDAGLNSGGQVIRYSKILGKNLRQRIREEYRRAILEFDIQISTRTSP